MKAYPYRAETVAWKRPPIDRAILDRCMVRSDVAGLAHCLGTLAILAATGTLAYYLFATRHWVLMALALYVHGGLFGFQPQTHELSHNTVFRTRWLNRLFRRVFGLVYWTSNNALYRMSHAPHHLYTVHRLSDGEVVLPAPETTERVLENAIRVVDLTGFIVAVYDHIYALFKPFTRNTRRNVWMRYVYANSSPGEQRDAYWAGCLQFAAHVGIAMLALAIHQWFLIVVVSLPTFYGGKWFALLVHDTMHSGRQPEADDFRLCCRTVRLDPVTSFLYWHMEYHTEHHAFAAIPCYRLKRFHELTREHWERPQSLAEAWREMNRSAESLLAIPPLSS